MDQRNITKYAKSAPYSSAFGLQPTLSCPKCGYVPASVQEAALREKEYQMEVHQPSPPESDSEEEDVPTSGQKVNAKNSHQNQYSKKRH